MKRRYYVYTNAMGQPLFRVVRTPNKDFFQQAYRPDHPKANRDGYIWGRDGIEPVLYRLHRVQKAVQSGETVFVVEGEKDVHTLESLGLVATTNTGGASPSKWTDDMTKSLEGCRQVVCIPDNDEPGLKHMNGIAAKLHSAGIPVRIVSLPGLPEKGDVSDWIGGGKTRVDLTALVEAAQLFAAVEDADSPSSSGKKNQAQHLLNLIDLAEVELFHDPTGTAYASYMDGGGFVTTRVEGQVFEDLLRRLFFNAEGRPPNKQAIESARSLAAALARYDRPMRPVATRICGHEGRVYIDLGSESGDVIQVSPEKWESVAGNGIPVRFRRTPQLLPLPAPSRDGDLSEVERFLNVDPKDISLFYGFLVGCLNPDGPYPLLLLSGEHGSGKSVAMRLLSSLIDPRQLQSRCLPRSEEDLMIAAERTWLLAFDNVSSIRPHMSDALCRLSTGGGFAARRLYTNRGERAFFERRPVAVNGIGDFATRPDLVDRSMIVRLKSIPEEERKPESELLAAFEKVKAKIFGGLLDAVQSALKNRDEVQLQRLPRMADFAMWVVAAEPALPIGTGEFLRGYDASRVEATQDIIDNDVVASGIVRLLDDPKAPHWEGTTTDLLRELEKPFDGRKLPSDFPRNYQALAAHLPRIMPALRAIGIEREEMKKTARRRPFRLVWTRDTDSGENTTSASPVSPAAGADVEANQAGLANDTPNDTGEDKQTDRVTADAAPGDVGDEFGIGDTDDTSAPC